jgi:hypothetical protein
MMKAAGPAVLANDAEAVQVFVANGAPVFELDTHFEGRLRRTHEILLVYTEQLVKGAEQRNRGFADTDSADLVGLDQADIEVLAQQLAHGGRGHPARRATADDYYFSYVVAIQDTPGYFALFAIDSAVSTAVPATSSLSLHRLAPVRRVRRLEYVP